MYLKPSSTKARPLGLRGGFGYDNIGELLRRVEASAKVDEAVKAKVE